MSKQIHTPTYISVGDFHISAEELQKIAPVEAMLLSIIGRSVNAKLKARSTLLDCAADIVLHLYHTIRRQQDFSPSLQEKEIQLKVNNLLKNCLRDMKIKTRNAPYAPLMLKAAYFDAEQRLTDDEEKRDVQAAYIDHSDYNDIAERASTQFDLARLRRAIKQLPARQRECATLMYKGMSVEEMCAKLNIKQSRAYDLIRQSTMSLRSLMTQPQH